MKIDSAIQSLLTVLARCLAHSKSAERGKVRYSGVEDLDSAFAAFSLVSKICLPEAVAPYPPGARENVPYQQNTERASQHVLRRIAAARTFEICGCLLAEARQCLEAGEESLSASAGSVTVLDIIAASVLAVPVIQAGVQRREVAHRQAPSTSGSDGSAHCGGNASRSPESVEVESVLRRICRTDVFRTGAAFVDAASARYRQAGASKAANKALSRTDPAAGLKSIQCRTLRDVPSLLDRLTLILYILADYVHEEFNWRGVTVAGPLLRDLVASLEQSDIIEVASKAVLDMTTPPLLAPRSTTARSQPAAPKPQQPDRRQARSSDSVAAATALPAPTPAPPDVKPGREGDFTQGLARCLAYLANGMSLLAMLATDMVHVTENGDGGGSAAAARGNGTQAVGDPDSWHDLSARLAVLLLKPNTQRLQAALLERFCLDGGVPPRSGAAAGSASGTSASSSSSAVGPFSSGWRLDDDLRLDGHLVCFYQSARQNPTDSGHALVLLTLASPALLTYSAAMNHAQLLDLLPPDLDANLARTLQATMNLLGGRGDAAGGFNKMEGGADMVAKVVWFLAPCGPSTRLGLSAAMGLGRRADFNPDSVEVLGWQLVACVTVAKMIPTAGADDDDTRDERPAADASCEAWERWWDGLCVGHRLRHVPHGLALLSDSNCLAGWNSLGLAAREEAARRLARAGLLPNLDYCLRLLLHQASTVLVVKIALANLNLVIWTVQAPLLRAMVAAADVSTVSSVPTPSASACASPVSAPIPSALAAVDLDLGFFVTLAKLSARLADQLQAATEAAFGRGGAAASGRAAEEAREKVGLLRQGLADCFDTLANFCTSVGPVGVEPGLHAAAARPDVQAHAALCLRAALAAGLAVLRSVDAQVRQAETQRREAQLLEDKRFIEALTIAYRICYYAPMCVTAGAGGGPCEMPPAVFLSTCPEELLALCCRSLKLSACAGFFAFPQDQRLGSSDELVEGEPCALVATVTLRTVFLTVAGLAAREDFAPVMHAWLSEAADSTGVDGSSSGFTAVPLRPALEQLRGLLEEQRPFGADSEQLLLQLQPLLEAVPQPGAKHEQAQDAEGQQEGGCGPPAWRGLWRAARKLLRETSFASRWLHSDCIGGNGGNSANGVHMTANPAIFDTSCAQALRGAGIPTDDRGFALLEGAADHDAAVEARWGERRQTAARQGIGETTLRLLSVKICGNPACNNFDEACEAALKLKRCGRCQAVWYCSGACQQQHWPRHKAACIRG